MGIVTATERRSEARDVYFPPHQLGMAHFAHASPDGEWILVVEMDQTHAFGLPCRLVPADGQSAGRQVGPLGTCTSAAWSPDGRWMYFGVNVGGRSPLAPAVPRRNTRADYTRAHRRGRRDGRGGWALAYHCSRDSSELHLDARRDR